MGIVVMPDRKDGRQNLVSTNAKSGDSYLVSVAEALSRPLPDADRRVICVFAMGTL
jgi:hypothetical protein